MLELCWLPDRSHLAFDNLPTGKSASVPEIEMVKNALIKASFYCLKSSGFGKHSASWSSEFS